MFQRAIITHGGAGSAPQNFDGPQTAAKIGMQLLEKGRSSLEAVVHAVRFLEDDPRFNAGIGSQLRADGRTIQMDASCMLSTGEFGAVACVEEIQNPIELAQGVLLHSPHILLVGDGARCFAKVHNIPIVSLTKAGVRTAHCNDTLPACDTVGAVAYDGNLFAAALSSGGLQGAALGRVGDVPLPGCGLFCGPAGAVACTGDGEFIALKILAKEVYGWLEEKMNPNEAAEKAMTLFDDSVDLGLIILTLNEFASLARNGMAWSHLLEHH
ncbi:isoaspartyl peptidase/L-asparaginase [Desulforhopalus sp. 52FAK]